VLSSTTESQEALEHAVSEDWKDPFVPKAEREAEEKAKVDAAKATLEAAETAETDEEKAADKEGESHEETIEERAQRIADEAEPVKGNWSKRVNKLTARNARITEELRQEREARERLESRLAAFERGEKPADKPSDSSAIADLPGKPRRASFKSEDEFVESLIDWTKKNEEYKEGQQEEGLRVRQVLDSHAGRVDEARDKYDDWDQVAKAAERMMLPIPVDFAIRELDNSAEVFYAIAKDPKLYERLTKMTPNQAIIEAGRISDRLAAGSRGMGGNGNGNGARRR
jgi:chromosome segregation ATPase